MVIHAVKVACKYRSKFNKDIVLDLFCYRRRGHNEADDPSATQPLMYQKIKQHPSVVSQYEDVLIKSGIMTKEFATNLKKNYRDSFRRRHNCCKKPC